MGLFPEKEPKGSAVKEVTEEPTALNIERKEVVTPVPTQFKAQVTDDSGQPLIQTSQTQQVTVTIPAINEEDLKNKIKGSKDETPAWSASFWMRAILKAIHFGKKILFKNDNT